MLDRIDFTQEKMAKAEYKAQYKQAIEKLVLLQQKARAEGIGLVVLFEGWDGAGKGSRISDLMYNLDARATSVHVTKDISPIEMMGFSGFDNDMTGYHPLMQEFWQSLGERGTITFYDRGWYTAAVEQSLYTKYGELRPPKYADFDERIGALLEDGAKYVRYEMRDDVISSYRHYAYNFERMLVNDGYTVIKFFVHVRDKVRVKRLRKLLADPNTSWRVSNSKLTKIKDYDRAYKLFDALLETSDFEFAPWTVLNGEDAYAANLQIANTLIDAIEGALNKKPDEAALAAKAHALANSAAQTVGETSPAEAKEQDDAEKVRFIAEGQARAQSAKAPASSEFLIVDNPPKIDHSVPMPVFEGDYKAELKKEQKRLFKLENEMFQRRVSLMVMYEGWDAAGKGGNIKRVAQAIDARGYTVFPSPAPTKPELAHPHLWRYWTRLPKAGHVGFYDRSWYGRVLVERVEGFASDDEWARAYDEINEFEYEMTQWGALLLKFWVDVSPEEQLRRFEDRAANPAKQWKMAEEDWRNRDKYPQYKAAVDDMFRLTSTVYAPWTILESDDKRYARLKALRTINEALSKRLGFE